MRDLAMTPRARIRCFLVEFTIAAGAGVAAGELGGHPAFWGLIAGIFLSSTIDTVRLYFSSR